MIGAFVTMSDTQTIKSPPKTWWRILLRLAVLALVAWIIGWSLNRLSATLQRRERPAGFGQGMIQGALMPMAMPNLLLGHDVVIYSTFNTGRGYKLGYTSGVTLCGAIVFGCFFWRVNRWRRP